MLSLKQITHSKSKLLSFSALAISIGLLFSGCGSNQSTNENSGEKLENLDPNSPMAPNHEQEHSIGQDYDNTEEAESNNPMDKFLGTWSAILPDEVPDKATPGGPEIGSQAAYKLSITIEEQKNDKGEIDYVANVNKYYSFTLDGQYEDEDGEVYSEELEEGSEEFDAIFKANQKDSNTITIVKKFIKTKSTVESISINGKRYKGFRCIEMQFPNTTLVYENLGSNRFLTFQYNGNTIHLTQE